MRCGTSLACLTADVGIRDFREGKMNNDRSRNTYNIHPTNRIGIRKPTSQRSENRGNLPERKQTIAEFTDAIRRDQNISSAELWKIFRDRSRYGY